MFNAQVSTKPAAGVLGEAINQREVAEVQAAIMLAKRFPRDQKAAIDNIMVACQRPGLAEAAVYEYARGGTAITGPSIRLAEAIAQAWGNIQFGIRELEQRNGESTVEAYAWDMETNTRQVKQFQVPHVRHTKSGAYRLSDPRDVYEMVANQGARRLRACILGVIPGDVVEAAVAECEGTMKAKADTGPEGQKKLMAAFEKMGVTKEQIEKRIQRRIDTITAAQMVGLRKIFNSMRDGMSTAVDWFEMPQEEPKKSGTEAAKEALKRGKGKDKEEIFEPGAPQKAEDTVVCPDLGSSMSIRHCNTECPKREGCPAFE